MAEGLPAPTSFPAPPPFHPHQCTRQFRGLGTSFIAATLISGFIYGNYLRHHDYKVRRNWLYDDRAMLRWYEDEVDIYQRESDVLEKMLLEAQNTIEELRRKYEPHLIMPPKKEETMLKKKLIGDPDMQDLYDFFDGDL